MNDRHPSGTATSPAPASEADPAHFASYGQQGATFGGDFTTYGDYTATGFESGPDSGTGAHATATGTFATDPLFGDLPGNDNGTGSYDASQWSTGSHQTLNYDPYAAQHHAAFDTGSYDTTSWSAGYEHLAQVPAQSTGPDSSGQWDASGWLQAEQLDRTSQLGADQTQQWVGIQHFATGVFDATQWNSDGASATIDEHSGDTPESHDHGDGTPDSYDHGGGTPESRDAHEHPSAEAMVFAQQATATFEQIAPYDQDHPLPTDGEFEVDDADRAGLLDGEEEVTPAAPRNPSPGRAAARAASRSRRRAPAKRSALLTVAVPSACVMGVAGIAAASVGVGGDDNTETTAATKSDATAVKPSMANNQLDTQLESLSAEADDFADRASRTQERIDLKAQQELEQKKAAAEAARKERLRPKFALPVSQHGLSAYYGQAGVNWMSLHTGIDFPVSYGTPVMAATDGTVRTQWNSAYGNMVIVTAKDGTETWYCHLSTYKVASGTTVKAGDVIAYSGNSGNSTGPHLHFEVHPAGGSAIDPLPWLRSHGLDPT
ncbi:M23 family metallopeptidase [Streptomyces ipomoeae]|uniref:M23 family metallopeptidase n=1 Tax=Streptomyces ipomoeae TaxID=103232 RepID=A0AAE8W4V3_9ACTN|nr:M23 family metallopeptidase [Streptomyces ipomoeae]TQE24108.1 M23 family metallopeptidase [Streptomyces ipomoeae]TQE35128.1 M23 family metallopeptidase [Streptomyces ipomoeae]